MTDGSSEDVRVLTFNVWGLHYLGAARIRERLGYIVEELDNYDIVGFQEVWRRDDFNFLVKKLENILPFCHYFHRTLPFRVCGSMRYLLDGELFSGKGIMMCRILTPSGPLAFYTTHLDPRHRDSQMFDIFQFVDQTRGTDPVIMTGDYNTKPTHDAYSFITTCLHLEDVFIDEPTDTCDLATNIFTVKHATPKRIDFVFYSNTTSTLLELTHKGRSLALTGHIPGKVFPYSDHEGVEAIFSLKSRNQVMSLPTKRLLSDSEVRCFLRMANNIETKQLSYRTNISNAIDFNLYGWMSNFGLGWVLLVVSSVLGVLGVTRAVTGIINSRIYLSMEAHLAEIRTLLKYNTIITTVNKLKEKTS